jgi:uncharacterized protein (DUF2147 family)
LRASAKRCLAALWLCAGASTFAQTTPVGLWKTIDDSSGKERSLVRIGEVGGVLSGRIDKRLDADSKPTDVCDKCSDDRKDKPLAGLEIIRGAKRTDGTAQWDGGRILDPDNGKVYRLRLTPLDGGKKLEVRGYIGPFFRNQQWIRVE